MSLSISVYNVPPGFIISFSCKYIELYMRIPKVLLFCMMTICLNNRLTPIPHRPDKVSDAVVWDSFSNFFHCFS